MATSDVLEIQEVFPQGFVKNPGHQRDELNIKAMRRIGKDLFFKSKKKDFIILDYIRVQNKKV